MDRVNVPGEGVYPMCVKCGMQTNPQAWGGHTRLALFRTGAKQRVQQEAAVDAETALVTS